MSEDLTIREYTEIRKRAEYCKMMAAYHLIEIKALKKALKAYKRLSPKYKKTLTLNP